MFPDARGRADACEHTPGRLGEQEWNSSPPAGGVEVTPRLAAREGSDNADNTR